MPASNENLETGSKSLKMSLNLLMSGRNLTN